MQIHKTLASAMFILLHSPQPPSPNIFGYSFREKGPDLGEFAATRAQVV